MKKSSIVIIVILVVALLFGMRIISAHNRLVDLDESVNVEWAEVENQLTRRASLIPNLLETVKGYAGHEKEVIESIANARKGYDSASTPGEYAVADEKFQTAVNNLNVIVENYPDLKANENFKDFQAELAGTENRISVARMRYNEKVEVFNSSVRRFPTNIAAKILGYDAREYFKASEADKEVPKVEF